MSAASQFLFNPLQPMKTIALFVFFLAALTGVFIRANSADTSPEKAAVIANDRAYEAAYAKADVKALADFFAEDADYTTDDGHTFSGREAIEGASAPGSRRTTGRSSQSPWIPSACSGPRSCWRKVRRR